MRALMAKDIRLVAPHLWAIVPAHALWCAQSLLSHELYFWTCLVFALGWTAAVLMIEWQFGTDRFVASLPVSRATIVKARYASALGGLAAGTFLFVVYGLAATAVVPERLARHWPDSPAWASADGVLALLMVGFVVIVSFLPFFFRFGLPLGGAFFGTVAVGVGGTLTAALHPVTTLGPSEALRRSLSSLAGAWGAGPALVAVLAAGAVAALLSVRLSVRFYEGRDL
jgi:hypothetical protein